MKHVHACLNAREEQESNLTTVEVLWGSCKPVHVRERPNKAILTSEEVLRSTCMPV